MRILTQAVQVEYLGDRTIFTQAVQVEYLGEIKRNPKICVNL